MLDQRDRCGSDRANRVIHFLDEEGLRIGHIAGEMKRKILPLSVGKQVVTGDTTRCYQAETLGSSPCLIKSSFGSSP